MNPILNRVRTQPACMLEGALCSLLREQPTQAAEHPRFAELRKLVAPKCEVGTDGVGVLKIHGILALNAHPIEIAYFGVEDTGLLLEAFEAAVSDDACKAIVLSVDSPGGFICGTAEFAAAVADCKSKKVVAYTGQLMASAAYWIGSQARAVVASRASVVGSIGVYTAVVDYMRLLENVGIHQELIRNKEGTQKALGVDGGNLRQHERDTIQGDVQAVFEMFKADVTRSRKKIRPEALTGKTFVGQQALDMGLADYLGNLDFAKRLALQAASS